MEDKNLEKKSKVNLSISVDEELVDQANDVLDLIGISMEEAITLLLQYIVKRKTIPFLINSNGELLLDGKTIEGLFRKAVREIKITDANIEMLKLQRDEQIDMVREVYEELPELLEQSINDINEHFDKEIEKARYTNSYYSRNFNRGCDESSNQVLKKTK